MADDVGKRITDYWEQLNESELAMLIPKAQEYSAVDLEVMGAAMQALAGAEDKKFGIEAAIAFYALGKIARIVGAIAEGRLPNEDSWVDLGIYARMAQRVREVGSWPG